MDEQGTKTDARQVQRDLEHAAFLLQGVGAHDAAKIVRELASQQSAVPRETPITGIFRQALKKISMMKYSNRSTVSDGIALDKFREINQQICNIFAMADDVLLQDTDELSTRPTQQADEGAEISQSVLCDAISAMGIAREYPDFDDGAAFEGGISPIRAALDDSIKALEAIREKAGWPVQMIVGNMLFTERPATPPPSPASGELCDCDEKWQHACLHRLTAPDNCRHRIAASQPFAQMIHHDKTGAVLSGCAVRAAIQMEESEEKEKP